MIWVRIADLFFTTCQNIVEKQYFYNLNRHGTAKNSATRHCREQQENSDTNILSIQHSCMKKSIILTALLATHLVAAAQTTITDYTPGISTEGATYHLPKTVVNVSITVEKSSYQPGELCQYAERYLRIGNISDKKDMHYSLVESALTTAGIPDEKKIYHIQFAKNSIAPLVRLSNDGILTAINTDPDVQEVATSTVATATPKAISSNAYMTEEMLLASSKAKLAELVAKDIYNIRESRNLILRGQNENMPKDGEALQIILDELDNQEKALMQLFVGHTSTEQFTYTFQVIPDSSVNKIILGRFSRKLGILHQDDLAGAPIYIDIQSISEQPKPTEAPATAKSSKSANKQDGLVYNIPGKAIVKVYTNTDTFAEETFTFGQFGNTETLSSDLLTKKKDIKVQLDPTTGALLKVED